jgi:hypothetical protein
MTHSSPLHYCSSESSGTHADILGRLADGQMSSCYNGNPRFPAAFVRFAYLRVPPSQQSARPSCARICVKGAVMLLTLRVFVLICASNVCSG